MLVAQIFKAAQHGLKQGKTSFPAIKQAAQLFRKESAQSAATWRVCQSKGLSFASQINQRGPALWPALGDRFRSVGFNRLSSSVKSRLPFNSQDSSQSALYALMAANGIVFLWWRADGGFCLKHFTTSWQAVKAGRIHTIVTAAFSQRDTMHLASNMLGLFFFGREVAYVLGGRGLILLYLTGAVVGNLVYVIGQAVQDRGSRHDYYDRSFFYTSNSGTPALGASGAVNGIVIFECLMVPTATVLIYGILPVPAIALGAMYLYFDIQGALGHGKSNVGYTTHLGGAVVGALAYVGVRRGRIPTRWRRW